MARNRLARMREAEELARQRALIGTRTEIAHCFVNCRFIYNYKRHTLRVVRIGDERELDRITLDRRRGRKAV